MNIRFIPVKTRNETARVDLDQIITVRNNLREILIETKDYNYSFYGSMEENVVPFLDDRFCICHGRCIINLDKVLKTKGNRIDLEAGKQVFLGKKSYQYTRKKFNAHLLNVSSDEDEK